MNATMQQTAAPSELELVLRLADNALILGQRMSEWCGHGPVLEEDIAAANIGLDLLGQARHWLSHAAALEGLGRDEDQLAYFREARDFRNCTLVELPNGDYAQTMLRLFLYSTFQCHQLAALADSSDATLAGIASRAAKENAYHQRHSAEWVIRFGDGTDESHGRAQRALDWLWPYCAELFHEDDMASSLRPAWLADIDDVLDEATLKRPAETRFMSTGKQGIHSEHLDYLLAEMQSVARAHPGVVW